MTNSYTAAIAAKSEPRKAHGLTPDDSDAAYRVTLSADECNQIAQAVADLVREELGGIPSDAAYDAAFESARDSGDVTAANQAGWRAGYTELELYQTPVQIAAWLKTLIEGRAFVPQTWIAGALLECFGDRHVYQNKHGHWAINQPVLHEFAKVTNDLVWSMSRKGWRPRKDGDPAGRKVR